MTDTKVDPILSPPEVKAEFKISEFTLAHWRSEGRGPDFIRMGRHIRYRRSALEAWLDANTVKGAEL